jgi:hypothetical protein
MKVKVCLREYIDLFYGKKKPSCEAMLRKCRKGEIPNAIKEGKKWYIVVEQESLNQREQS